MSVERMMDRVCDVFWPDYEVSVDHLNSFITVLGDSDELYKIACQMRDSGIFTGFVGRLKDGIKIKVVGPYEPPRF